MAKRGQAALEYLTTYGWVLVIIVIVAAALYALGLLNPATYQPHTCTGFSSLTYTDHVINSSGAMKLVLKNGVGKTITSANISSVKIDGTEKLSSHTEVTSWAAGGEKTLSATLSGSYSKGDPYTATVEITYVAGGIKHTEIGTCTGKIE